VALIKRGERKGRRGNIYHRGRKRPEGRRGSTPKERVKASKNVNLQVKTIGEEEQRAWGNVHSEQIVPLKKKKEAADVHGGRSLGEVEPDRKGE